MRYLWQDKSRQRHFNEENRPQKRQMVKDEGENKKAKREVVTTRITEIALKLESQHLQVTESAGVSDSIKTINQNRYWRDPVWDWRWDKRRLAAT